MKPRYSQPKPTFSEQRRTLRVRESQDPFGAKNSKIPGIDITFKDNQRGTLPKLLKLNQSLRSSEWPYPFNTTTHHIKLGDARNLEWISSRSVHLVVTSPPYWTLKQLVPTAAAIVEKDFVVARGPTANIEVGVEAKILAKAVIKQIDRVIGDLQRQVQMFKKSGGNPICAGFVGINNSSIYTSYEGRRKFPTDGKKYKHPIQEAADAEARSLALLMCHHTNFLGSTTAR